MLTLLVGGARSGKSALAVTLVARHDGPVAFLATAEPLDDEMAARIASHRSERPAHWTTIEEPIELEREFAELPAGTAVVVDCLTLWVSNLLGRGLADEVEPRARSMAARAAAHAGPVVVISNEVGAGIVPADPLTRRFRDELGAVNATFAAASGATYLVVAGRVLALSSPEVVDLGTRSLAQ
jgi:adenosyl cobinamide kinase/adenosyl cobinamide phosphate guanylyltransferase